MKPFPDKTNHVRAKGGRANGGTRYYSGKSKGEDKMINLMQKALDKKKIQQEIQYDLSIDELIAILKLSHDQTEKLIREVKTRCSQKKM